MQQRGISGNKDFGCDAIVVSGARKDDHGQCVDLWSTLEYWAETTVGAGSILKTMEKKNPIRVFRSSVLPNSYQAIENHDKRSVSARGRIYRYDGLYQVTEVSFVESSGMKISQGPENLSPLVIHRLYYFQLVRLPAGRGADRNEMSDDTFMENCRAWGTRLP
jgi:hypothetical protein